MMNKKPYPVNLVPQPPADDSEADRLFDELQTLWDEEGCRIDKALAAAAPPAAVRPADNFRTRMLQRYLLLLAVAVAAAVCWALLFPPLAYTTLALAVCLLIETIYLLLSAECLLWSLRLSGFVPHTCAKPMPAEGSSRQHSADLSASLAQRRSAQVAAACLAAVATLVVTSCAPTGGDGYAITCNLFDRTAVVEEVAQALAQL